MKKLLAVLLACLTALSFAACGKTDGDTSAPSAFVKPDGYATVLLVTINPQFRLYLDAKGNVLAVEPVNKDAEDIADSITFENESYEQVIGHIITVANENGFIKEDATVKFEVIEDTIAVPEGSYSAGDGSSAPDERDEPAADRSAEILSKAQTAADSVAKDLDIKIDVQIEIVTGSTGTTSTSAAQEPSATESIANTTAATTAHTHSFSDATCTAAKTCACGATEGKALGHSYKDGVCTRCKAKDPSYISPIAKKAGNWVLSKLVGEQLISVYIDAYGEENGLSFEKAEPFSSLSDEVKNNASPSYIREFNGAKYLAMLGDGDIAIVTEDGKTVSVVQGSFKLVLSREDEDTLKVNGVENVPSYFPSIVVGDVFRFVAQ